ncbi:MAG: 40S ribosomal protein S19 [Candidatus Micrarchaeota archaeon]|nr:40S ribosomal protein S19 [Candidatus Micrarchaeota archaeon]
MAGVYGVEPNKLISEVAKRLEGNVEIKPPKFLGYGKTGPHVEFGPEDKRFWYVRCASILRQAYVKGEVSVGGLRVHYGGRKRHRVASAHHVDAGG